jgi:hypothetical protein
MVIQRQEEATDPYPTFERVGFANDDVIFHCADSTTVNWLKEAIGTISNSWGQGDLSSHSEVDLFKMKKITISVPWDNLYHFNPLKVLSCLERANRGLSTSLWLIKRLIDPEAAHGRKIIALLIDVASSDYIESHGRRLYYQLGSVKVRFHYPGGRGDDTDF